MSDSDSQVAATFLEIVDALVDDFDVVDVLSTVAEHCARLLGAPEVGLMLVDPSGNLQVVGSSTSRMQGMELFELQNSEGPCLDCFNSGKAILNQELDGVSGERWPLFGKAALAAGFDIVHALPMRLRKDTIGALNIFNSGHNQLTTSEAEIAQALADAASIAILQDKALRQATVVAEQLQHALDSRVVIEQANGFIAERLGGEVADSFALMRTYARSHSLRLSQVAVDIVQRKLDPSAVVNSSKKY